MNKKIAGATTTKEMRQAIEEYRLYSPLVNAVYNLCVAQKLRVPEQNYISADFYVVLAYHALKQIEHQNSKLIEIAHKIGTDVFKIE